MQKACRDRLLVHFQVCQNDGDIERMNDIRLARAAELALVRLHGNVVGLLDQRDIIRGVIFPDPLDEILVKNVRGDILCDGFHPPVVKTDAFASGGSIPDAFVQLLLLFLGALRRAPVRERRRCLGLDRAFCRLRVTQNLCSRGIHLRQRAGIHIVAVDGCVRGCRFHIQLLPVFVCHKLTPK